MRKKSKSKQRALSKSFVLDQLSVERSKRRLLLDALRPNEERDLAFRHMIFSIPPGRVSTYGRVATAAGYPRYHRAVARLLRTDPVDQLPWHRVVGAGQKVVLEGMGHLHGHGASRADVAEDNHGTRNQSCTVVNGGNNVFDRDFQAFALDQDTVRSLTGVG